MRENENIKIQMRISSTVALIGILVTAINIIRNVYIRGNASFEIIFKDPSISLVFIFSVLFFLTRKIRSSAIQILQIIVFLANAALAILDGYDKFHGIGFIILTLLLAYRYGMLEKYTRIKMILLGVFTLFFLELSIHLSGNDHAGSGLDIILYLIFFLSIIYLIYMNEINRLLRNERVFHKTISDLETEKNKLMVEVKNHKLEILDKETRIHNLIIQISNLNSTGEPLKLKEDFNITQREEDVIREFCLNPHLTTKDLALNLNMSLGTIKQHFNSIFRKLKVRSRSDLLNKCKWNFQ